ncbi:hypothetical protein [Flavivirga spongiicola]|uniref:YceI family protein n=1 Tax=Flavivirga spongiicola TaxID=421621 RepID=A0ABU7XY76_9FLAO|nr:hypothetical protein [Flavivirga sp. MEBiC05379]MDO5980522.1 hypothetical protein [Flavivirga sp. MEBiC05379]
MKKSILLLFFFICNVSALIAQNKEWVKVKDTVNAYIIEFPTKPQKGSQDVPTAKGTVKMHTYTSQTENDKNKIYMTSFTKYPKSFFENGLNTFESQNRVLNGSIEGAVTNTKGRLVSDKKITFNGYHGRDVKIEVKSLDLTYMIEMRTVLAGYNLYLTQIIYEKMNKGHEEAKHFFESFELINVKQ